MAEYIALYREWRPAKFADVIGQDHVTRTLRNALQGERLAHAYLFAGPRGTGKTSVAKILARAVNCERPDQGEPCGKCEPCRLILDGQAMDVLEIDAASNRGIDEIRDLREMTRFAPSGLKCKVYIVDEVHMLTDPAFNALLKTLEEPPAGVLFVLATTEVHKIPATILSRCQRFDFHRIDLQQIMERLRQVCEHLKIEYTEPAIYQIARHADGGLRDALSLLDQCNSFADVNGRLDEQIVYDLLGYASEDDLATWLESMLQGDLRMMITTLDHIHESGRDMRQAVRDAMSMCRDVLLLQADDDSEKLIHCSMETIGRLRRLSESIPADLTLSWLRRLAEADRDMRGSTLPRVVLEMHLLEEYQKSRMEASGEMAAARMGTGIAVAPAEDAGTPADAAAAEPSRLEAGESAWPGNDAEWNELWAKALEEVRAESPVARALLEAAAMPERLPDGGLRLVFPARFYADRLQEKRYADLLQKSFQKVWRRPVHVVFQVRDEHRMEGNPKPASGRNEGNDPDLKTDPLVREVAEFFGGKIIREGKDEEQ